MFFKKIFLNEVTLFQHLRSDRVIFADISVLLVFAEKRPLNRAFFKNFVVWFSLKQCDERITNVVLEFPNPQFYFWQTSRSWVIVKDELSTDQILELLNVQYVKNKLRYPLTVLYVSNKSVGLGLAWLDIAKILQNFPRVT